MASTSLKERQKSVLGAAVQEHIRTARPVASRDLVRHFRLGVSPATVRNEMLELDVMGYLEQPHTSAGRVPTDKGYRFFIDYLMADGVLDTKERLMIKKLFELAGEDEFVKELSRLASQVAGAFAAVGTFGEEIFYEAGFSAMLEEPEFQVAENVKIFGRLVDGLEEEVREFLTDFEGEERILVGGENPLRGARSCAMMVSRWSHPAGFDGFLAVLSPKRTNYQRHKALLKTIHEFSL